MKPRKAKDFIPETARMCDVEEELVKDLVSHYYSTIRNALSSLASPRVHMDNLGDFVIKHWKIEAKATNIANLIPRVQSPIKWEEKLSRLNNMSAMVKEEKDRKEFIKLHKKLKDEPTIHLEEPESDT